MCGTLSENWNRARTNKSLNDKEKAKRQSLSTMPLRKIIFLIGAYLFHCIPSKSPFAYPNFHVARRSVPPGIVRHSRYGAWMQARFLRGVKCRCFFLRHALGTEQHNVPQDGAVLPAGANLCIRRQNKGRQPSPVICALQAIDNGPLARATLPAAMRKLLIA